MEWLITNIVGFVYIIISLLYFKNDGYILGAIHLLIANMWIIAAIFLRG